MPTWLIPVWFWLKKAGAWLRKYWMWVLFPLGALWVLLKLFKSPPKVVAPEASGAAAAQLQARGEADEQITEAARIRDEGLAEVAQEHAEQVKGLVQEQETRAEELQGEPEKLNDFLRDVGEDMRK